MVRFLLGLWVNVVVGLDSVRVEILMVCISTCG